MAEVWIYIDASTVEIAGDSTARYWPNLIVTLTQTTQKFFIITAVNLVSGNTRLALNGCGVYSVANAAITAHGVTANWAAQGIPAGFGAIVPNGNGNVGINESSPAARLTINGGCNIGGNTDPGDNNLQVEGKIFVSGSGLYMGKAGESVGASLYLHERATGYSEAIMFLDADGSTIRALIIKDNADGLRFRAGDSSNDDLTLDASGNTRIRGNFTCGGKLVIIDGMTAPDAITGSAQIYVDSADGDLKIKFGDGTVKTIAVDT